MKNDLSNIILEKYFETHDISFTFLLKNGKKINGYIVGYCYDDDDHTAVYQWHIVPEIFKNSVGLDPLGFLIGEHVLQIDIMAVEY
jgi:hypothetical protein